MLRVNENKDEIIVRSIPIQGWITASVIALVLVSIVSTLLIVKPETSNLIKFIPVFIFLSGFLFFILKTTPATTIKINKPGKTISIRKQSFIKYSFDIYSFDEIADLIYIDSTIGGRNETASFQTFLPLKNGNRLELSIHSGLNDNEYFEIVDKMNSYIFDTSKQIPFRLTIFNND